MKTQDWIDKLRDAFDRHEGVVAEVIDEIRRDAIRQPEEIPLYYQTTYLQCKEKIGDVVCDGCGGVVEPIETVNNSGEPTYWSGCKHCNSFTSGVNRRAFEVGRILVAVDDRNEYKPKIDYAKDVDRLESWLDTETRAFSRLVCRIQFLLEHPEEKPPNTDKWLSENLVKS